ncbi:MAG: hypothetical protein J7L22_05885 [Candidatus Marinimicrobia bacterium]|nr:hypothetical protein [Candidatus Neomarinimicrobiota bacterium]
MACQKDKKQFELTINGKTFELLGLDDCVFGTLISFPENDEDIAEMMWEQLCLCNDLSSDDKETLLPALLEFYKDEYSPIDSNCAGCDGCG